MWRTPIKKFKNMNNSLKEEIIKRIDAKNLSIAELERKAGLPIHSVRNIIQGRVKKPRVQTLQAIADTLECSILDLMNSSSRNIKSIGSYKIEMQNPQPFENLELMRDCFKTVIELMAHKELTLTVDDFFECIEIIYSYSLSDEPKVLDFKFTKWVVDNKICNANEFYQKNLIKF